MKNKILFVDDEQNILDTYRASLRKRFKVETALGPKEGLEKIQSSGPYAVVVSDLKMPKMDGITFLNTVKKLSPDTVRVMLTGHADLECSIAAVNEGSVFRFLTKPSPIDVMIRTLQIAMKQYSLVTAERELLRGTLRGSVKVLTDILALANPEAFGRSERVRRLTAYVGKNLNLKHPLQLDLAAMLGQLGCVTLTNTVLKKVFMNEKLTDEEQQVFDMHPSVAAGMLSQIPRMGVVSNIILHQHDSLKKNPDMPPESRVIKACLDYDSLIQQKVSKQDAIDTLRSREGIYDSKILDVLERGTAGEEGYVRREIELSELLPGMILDEALWSMDEVHLVAEGTKVTETALIRINNFIRAKRVPPKVRVLVPIKYVE